MKLVHLGARTLRDPEEPEWEVIVIIVNADFGFKNFEHRFVVDDKIEEIVEDIIDKWREKVQNADKGKVEEANAITSEPVLIDLMPLQNSLCPFSLFLMSSNK